MTFIHHFLSCSGPSYLRHFSFQALLDGPCTGVPRQARRFNEVHLTSLVTKIARGASERSVRIAWTADKITDKWNATSWARRIEKRVKVIPLYFSFILC